MVCEFEPHIGLAGVNEEPDSDPVPLSLPLPFSLSLSKINKTFKIMMIIILQVPDNSETTLTGIQNAKYRR